MTESANPQPTVVLVHGAFAESASWNGVISRLQTSGYRVVALANPLRSLEGDAQYVREVLAGIEGPVVLAGHSYGGSVISGAATGNPQVTGLVYVAAFAPEKGETALELTGRFPGSTLGETLSTVPLADGSNDVSIKPELFRDQFAADVAPEAAALAAATQRPVRDVALGQAAGEAAWHTVPSWFLIAGADKNIPPAAQRFMAERAGARDIVEVQGASHSVAVSHPDEVAGLITAAATASAR